jgi:hypothetical protein
MDISSYFSFVKDFLVVSRCSHLLSDILCLVLVAVLADCDVFSEIYDYGTQNIAFLCSDLGFTFANGIPSKDTLERVFKYLKANELEKCYRSGEPSIFFRRFIFGHSANLYRWQGTAKHHSCGA